MFGVEWAYSLEWEVDWLVVGWVVEVEVVISAVVDVWAVEVVWVVVTGWDDEGACVVGTKQQKQIMIL